MIGEWVPLVCDGRLHVEDIVLDPVQAFTGDSVTVHAVLRDENTLTTYASDTRTVTVH